MINQDLFLRFGAALLIGVMIGLQREFAHGSSSGTGLFAGARTFALMSLVGTTAAFLAEILGSIWVFITIISLLTVMVIIAYYVTAIEREEIGLTSEVAAVITILVGAICYLHSIELAAALGVVTTVLLAAKGELRDFVQGITQEDVYATLQFAVITAIVLPVLPNRTFGPPPINVLNPTQIWEMVIFISGINFLGYILVKVIGPQKGLGISGLVGGLASSTATTMSFSERSRDQEGMDRPFAVAIIGAWIIMFIRVIIEVAVVNVRLLPRVWPALAAMGLAGLIYALYMYFSQSAIDEEELSISNPFELGTAIKFGLIFALVLVGVKTAEIYLGDSGIYLTSFIAGLADVDAITLSIADLTRTGASISLETGKYAIILATISNTLAKSALVFTIGSRSLRKFIWPIMLVMIVLGIGLSFIV